MINQKVIQVGKIFSLMVLSLGLIHDIATFTPLIQDGLSLISASDRSAMIYFSLMCGTSLVLSGLLLFLMLNKINQIHFLRGPMLIIGIFLALSGFASVFYMLENPFAWMALFINFTMFAIVLRINFKKP